MLVNLLTGSEVSDYEYVKKYVIDQFRLCPQFFPESFNRIQCFGNANYKAFVARISRLLQYTLWWSAGSGMFTSYIHNVFSTNTNL